MENELKAPHHFKTGTVVTVGNFPSDGGGLSKGLWLVVGGVRNLMDMNSGYTMPAIDANRWMACREVKGIKVKRLKEKTHEYLRLHGSDYDTHLVDRPIKSRDWVNSNPIKRIISSLFKRNRYRYFTMGI